MAPNRTVRTTHTMISHKNQGIGWIVPPSASACGRHVRRNFSPARTVLTARSLFGVKDRRGEEITMFRVPGVWRRPIALIITAIAASDVAYRLLLRAPIRRGLGIGDH